MRTLLIVVVLVLLAGCQPHFEQDKASAAKRAKASQENLQIVFDQGDYDDCCLRLEAHRKSVAPQTRAAWDAAERRLDAEFDRRRESDGLTEAVKWYKVETAKSAAQIIANWGPDAGH